MRNLLCGLLLLLPLSAHALFLDCVFFDGFENPGTTDSAALAALQVHNCARKTVDPAASSPIPSLVWDATVASTAQDWASGCVWSHGDHDGLGQNIYAATGITPDLADAAMSWAGEEPYYNYAANTCNTAKPPNTAQTCGHYTQMVWNTTTQLGCGQASCTTGSPFGSQFPNWNFIVCDYNPPGNVNNGRPY